MCLTAIDMKPSIASTGSKPYCWGYGVGTGLIPAATYTKCSRSVGSTYKTVSTTTTVYFDSLQPVDSAGVISNLIGIDIANTNQISGLGTNERAYYWGLHGYTKTVASTGKQTGTGCTYRVEDTEKNGKHDHPKTHPNCGGGKPGCSGGGAKKYKTVYRYDLRTTYVRIGSVTALGPLYNGTAATGPLNQRTLTAASGNAYDGLFCAAIDSATYCDAHGTSMSEGQTGSNYAQPCTTTGSIFKTTTCSSAPTGPQQVTATGWLAGKTISSLETGSSGYTCAIASGSVGCWGVNNSGQLGTGDKTNRKVPTAVSNL